MPILYHIFAKNAMENEEKAKGDKNGSDLLLHAADEDYAFHKDLRVSAKSECLLYFPVFIVPTKS